MMRMTSLCWVSTVSLLLAYRGLLEELKINYNVKAGNFVTCFALFFQL